MLAALEVTLEQRSLAVLRRVRALVEALSPAGILRVHRGRLRASAGLRRW
jgi:hypothetical protein